MFYTLIYHGVAQNVYWNMKTNTRLSDTQVSSNISSFKNEIVSMHSGWPLHTSGELTNMLTLF